jgi:hypothetical protein
MRRRRKVRGPEFERVRATVLTDALLDTTVEGFLAHEVLGNPKALGKNVRELRDDEQLVVMLAATLAWADAKSPTGPHRATTRAQRRGKR